MRNYDLVFRGTDYNEYHVRIHNATAELTPAQVKQAMLMIGGSLAFKTEAVYTREQLRRVYITDTTVRNLLN